MKKIFLPISALIAGITLFSSCEDKKPKMDTFSDSLCYAQGLIGGTNYCKILESEKIEGNKDLFYEAFRAGFQNDSATFIMTREEAFDLIREYNEELTRKAQEELERKHNEEAAFNKVKADEFLKKYKEEKNVVTLESGVMYKVLKVGYGPKPTLQDTVVFHYEGKLIDGKVLSNSRQKKEPGIFCMKDVPIQGLKLALQEMPKYSTWEVVIPPDLAFGKEGAGDKIPSNSAVIFKVELMKIIER